VSRSGSALERACWRSGRCGTGRGDSTRWKRRRSRVPARGASSPRRGATRAECRPRPRAPPAALLHRRAGPLRLGRADARVPMGLLVLQRVDVLREELPQGECLSRGRGSRAHRGAERLPGGRRRLHPGRARLRDRRGARAGQGQSVCHRF